MKKRFTRLSSTVLGKLIFLTLILGLAHHSCGDQIGLNIQLQQVQSQGNGVSYGANIALTSGNGPITYYEVIAPNGAFIATVGSGPSGIGTAYGDAGSLMAGMTNGLGHSFLTAVIHRLKQITLRWRSIRRRPPILALLTLFSPLITRSGSIIVPTLRVIGPTNLAAITVDAHDNNYNVYTSTELPAVATNWTPGVALDSGFNFFEVTYTNGNNGNVTISTPTNSLGQPLANWTATASFQVQDTIDFFVGALPALVAHYTFDDSNYLSQDISGNSFDLQGPSWFGQPPGPSTNGFGGGALQCFGSGWYNLPPVILSALASNFTVSVWLETTNMVGNDNDIGNGDAGVLWADNNNGQSNCAPLDLTGSKAAFYTGDTIDTLTSATSVTTGQYVHIVVTRNIATGVKDIYINGVLDNSDTGGTGALNDSTGIELGYNFNGLATPACWMICRYTAIRSRRCRCLIGSTIRRAP